MVSQGADSADGFRAKRQKTSGADMDPKANPYLAHMYSDDYGSSNNGTSYGYGSGKKTSALAKFKRHATTAALANAAEDGPNNAFTSGPLSDQYFRILKTRRNLPVHVQRYLIRVPREKTVL